MSLPVSQPKTLTVTAPLKAGFDEILTPEALQILAALQREFGSRRRRAAAEAERSGKRRLDAGELPDFLEETASIRAPIGRWRRSRKTCWTAASKSPGRWIARW